MRILLVITLLLAPAALQAQSCSNLDPATGYPLVASAPDELVEIPWLNSMASAAAYRWKVPSRRRNIYSGWERVERRILPPEPRWADDWNAKDLGTATMRVTLFRDSRQNRAEVLERSGNGTFDRSLESIVSDPMPGSPDLPAFPPHVTADSLVVMLVFGEVPEGYPQGLVRFAAEQTRSRLRGNSMRVQRPAGFSGGPRATVKYDITAQGRVDPVSVEFVQSTNAQFEDAIRDALMSARFEPPTSNRQPLAQTVVQTFG